MRCVRVYSISASLFHNSKALSYDKARFQLNVSRGLKVEVYPCRPIMPTTVKREDPYRQYRIQRRKNRMVDMIFGTIHKILILYYYYTRNVRKTWFLTTSYSATSISGSFAKFMPTYTTVPRTSIRSKPKRHRML